MREVIPARIWGQALVSKNQVEEIDKAMLKFISIQTALFTSLSPDPAERSMKSEEGELVDTRRIWGQVF
jgi:hypothetical protein